MYRIKSCLLGLKFEKKNSMDCVLWCLMNKSEHFVNVFKKIQISVNWIIVLQFLTIQWLHTILTLCALHPSYSLKTHLWFFLIAWDVACKAKRLFEVMNEGTKYWKRHQYFNCCYKISILVQLFQDSCCYILK